MRILGLAFVGTATGHRTEMAAFLRDVLALPATAVDGVEADLVTLPDGSVFAVASPGGMGDTDRTIGFLVDDLASAVATLAEHGVDAGPTSTNAEWRYAHFRAPDGHLYELLERRATNRH